MLFCLAGRTQVSRRACAWVAMVISWRVWWWCRRVRITRKVSSWLAARITTSTLTRWTHLSRCLPSMGTQTLVGRAWIVYSCRDSLTVCGLFYKEVNKWLAKCPLVFNRRLANHWLTFLVKEATSVYVPFSHYYSQFYVPFYVKKESNGWFYVPFGIYR